jgi:hypothetical protein
MMVMVPAGSEKRVGAPDGLVIVGAAIFILMLAISAYWEPDIRWLHLFQSAMYIVPVALILRKNRWGYFVAVAVAGFWDYANVFATGFFSGGLHEISRWVRTGEARFDQMIAVPAWFSNLLIVIGACWGYFGLARKSASDAARLVVAVVLSTGFFAADMAIFQPRFLGIFSHLRPSGEALLRFLPGG